MSYTEHKICRACGGTSLAPVFDLGNQALANDHAKPDAPRQGFYPLKILFCEDCGLAQLSVVVNRNQLYARYSYVSSSSQTMQRHYKRLFLDILSEQPEKRILEIASNDGSCLQYAKALGFEVLGIDPAFNLAQMAVEKGISTLPDFFSVKPALNLKTTMPSPGVILARHVFAHVDDWKEFIAGLEVLANRDTLIVLEFPYVLDLLRSGCWDTIYHEHLSVISLKPIVKLLARTPFHIHRVVKMGIHGGALAVMLRHRDSDISPHISADEFIHEENVSSTDWKELALRASHKIERLKELVRKLKSENKIVCVFGASAKATVLINACGWDKYSISFVSDNSPLKPGCLVPGTDIPIIEEDEFLSHHADYAILSAWNYFSEIMEKTSKWRARGGRFIVPDDCLRIV